MKSFWDQSAQTTVEYILLLAVVVSIGLSFFETMNQYLLENPDSVINQYLGSYRGSFDQASGYRTFRLVK